MKKITAVTVVGLLFPVITGCGGGGGSDPAPTPTPTPSTWTLNVGGEEKTITEGQIFDLGWLQLCEVVKRGGEWRIDINQSTTGLPGISGCAASTSVSGYSATYSDVTVFPDGVAHVIAQKPGACPVSKTQYNGNIRAHDINADVTYTLASFPADFDFSQSNYMHISALKDDGTGNGVLEVATGPCPTK